MSQALQKFPVLSKYDELLRAVRKVMAEGRTRAEQAVEQERVRTYWEAGKLIDEHILQHKERAAYGAKVIIRLAKDLGSSETELKYMLQFARTYPIRRPADELSWSEYEALLAVNQPEERKALAKRAVKENWKRDRLRQEVRKIKRENQEEGTNSNVGAYSHRPLSLTAEPGKLQTYRVIRAKAGPLKGELALDLGFATYLSLRAVTQKKFSEGVIVFMPSPQPSPSGRGQSDGKATITDLFTYAADIYEVIDGDTVNAVVDLGFGICTQQTLRLRGIDAPELITSDGREAKEALERMIAKGSSVLIRTTKSDKYDRYLVDLWINEIYANQKLVDEGYAVIVEE